MRMMLDTHAFVWWVAEPGRLPEAVYRLIADEANDVFVSAASAWEIAAKHRIGKLPDAAALALDVAGNVAGQGFEALAITVDDAERAGRLPGPHRDPFDRLLIAQSQARALGVVSNDRVFDGYGVNRLW